MLSAMLNADAHLLACLPASLRDQVTAIEPLASSFSGARVFRVTANTEHVVLKLPRDGDDETSWRRSVAIQRAAADAGVGPRVRHVDEARRAVVTAFGPGPPFPARFGDPRTRDAAIAQLGRALARVHALPIPAGATTADPRDILRDVADALRDRRGVPAFVTDTLRRALDEPPPPSDREVVLCHNDVHPANLLFDGDALVLVDWDVAAPNEPLYDIAAISLFLGMDAATTRALVAAHDGQPCETLPPRLAYDRRLVGIMCGALFLRLAGDDVYAGPGTESLDATPTLRELFQRMRTGAIDLAAADGRWTFGLALVKEGLATP